MTGIVYYLDEQIERYEKMCALTALEIEAFKVKDWVEVERIESVRVDLFAEIMKADGMAGLSQESGRGLQGEDGNPAEGKPGRLMSAMALLTEMDAAMNKSAREEMVLLDEELRRIRKRRAALRGYNHHQEGSYYIDRET